MRVLVCGGRDFDDWMGLRVFMSNLASQRLGQGERMTVIHGGARGADRFAGEWAKDNGISVEAYHADWKKHGKSAGPIRNRKMLEQGRPDVVVAFRGGRGTADMIRRAEAAGVKVIRA